MSSSVFSLSLLLDSNLNFKIRISLSFSFTTAFNFSHLETLLQDRTDLKEANNEMKTKLHDVTLQLGISTGNVMEAQQLVKVRTGEREHVH